MIELRTLGPVEVTVGGAPAPRELLWRKNLALLVYLARSPDRRRSREHLVGMFWGDKPDSSARHSLNEALRVIRKAAGDGLITSVGDQLELSTTGIRADTEALEARIATEDWKEAASLVNGTFLEGFVLSGSFEFEDWLAAERAHWKSRAGEALRRFAEACLAHGDAGEALTSASRAVAMDPFSDAAVRLAMLAAALRGERAAALAAYDAYAERLAAELGLEPDPETETLAARIRVEREWRLPDTVSETERWARRIPLVGRERELEVILDSVYGSFTGGAGALVYIEGESGAGKTRLGEEIAARARLEGAIVSHIRAVPSDRDTQWSGLSGLITSLLEAGCVAERSSEGPSPEALTEIALTASSSGPVLLWVDGAEHLDPESAMSLQAVLRDLAGSPCTLLLTAAAYPPRSELDQLRSRIGRDLVGVAVGLRPLDTEGLEVLASHVLPDLDEEATARLVRRIEADSAGLPLLALELLNAVRLGLEVGEIGGAWPRPFQTMEQTYPGDLPDSVVAAIRIGYRRLGRTAQQVLVAAAVLDDRCDPATLARTTGLEASDLDEALDELEWNRWLVAESRGYVFVARIMRDVIARDMLTPGQRRRLLAAVGRT